MRVVLASKSPARLLTLRRAGLDPEVIVSDVDESLTRRSSTGELVAALAEQKADSVFAQLTSADQGPRADEDLIVIGCDSVLDFEGRAVGKPGTSERAVTLWKRLRLHSGLLITGHRVIVRCAGSVQADTRVARTVVHFADLSDEDIDAYVATGEPAEVAGGFTIDGFGGPFITHIEGDHHNVVGVSLPLLRLMLADLGVSWTSLWSPRP
ncbi:MAG: Maf family nucleotide pyrophosphatase [Propionibacteriaceae bacterium]|jgi:septum formation protein|nr:Maf family nucleotide pyrophosphatase [Propionibacteriaceae bacterium]